MRNLVLLLVFGMLLPGCGGISSHSVTLPDGTQGYSVRCDKKRNDWGDCYNEAAEKCGGRYEIVERFGSETPVVMMTGGNVAGTTSPKRSIIVRCN